MSVFDIGLWFNVNMSLIFQILIVLIIGILLIKISKYEGNYELSAYYQDDKRYYRIKYNKEIKRLEAFQNITNDLLFSLPLIALNIKIKEEIIPEECEYIDEDKKILGRMAIGGALGGLIGGLPVAELGIFAGALSCMGLKKVVTKPKEHNVFITLQAGIGKEYIFKIPSYQKPIAEGLNKRVKIFRQFR